MKDKTPSLDDIVLFLAICDAGGLAGATARTGASAPTLSRRMTALEKQVGRRLFERGNKGYRLTADGKDLREKVGGVTDIRHRLGHWMKAGQATRIKITAGTWTSRWLAQNLGRYWSASDGWVPEFLASNAYVDMARREADIGFRNRRPDQNWLAGRKLRRIEYAEYATSPDVTGFVTLADHLAIAPSMRWVHTHRADKIVSTVSDPRLELDLVRQGMARAVLPTFAADAEPGLLRLSDPIEVLTHDEWLVTHQDARHDPPIRRAIDALIQVIEREST